MVAFLIYMVKTSCCLSLFYLFFKIFLSRDTFFSFNRSVLIWGMLLCFILPAVALQLPMRPVYIQQPFLLLENIRTTGEVMPDIDVGSELGQFFVEEESQADVPAVVSFFAGLNVLTGLYVLGMSIVFCRYLIGLGRIGILIRRGRKLERKGYKLILTAAEGIPCSFGKYIVLPEKDYQENAEEILGHERIHVEKHHTLDLILMEAVQVCQWFNPVAWLLKRELLQIHEYQADLGALHLGIDATKYQLLLVRKAVGARLYSIANSFNHSKLKNRITMMLKEKSNRWARLKVLLLIPPAIFAMFAFARPDYTLDPDSSEAFKITQIPEESKKWDEEFFKREYRKNAARLKLSQHYDQLLKGHRIVLMNRKGSILFDNKVMGMEEVKTKLAASLMARRGENALITFIQKDIDTPAEKWSELLGVLGNTYQAVRQEIGQKEGDQSTAFLDQECPVLVYVCSGKFMTFMPPPPPPSPLIFLTLSGDGVEEVDLLAYDLKQFGKRLDEVENLKQYTDADLSVKKDRIDSVKEQILQALRERGILKVNLKATE